MGKLRVCVPLDYMDKLNVCVSQRYHLCHVSVEVKSPCNTHSEILWDDRDMARACVPLISGCGISGDTISWTS